MNASSAPWSSPPSLQRSITWHSFLLPFGGTRTALEPQACLYSGAEFASTTKKTVVEELCWRYSDTPPLGPRSVGAVFGERETGLIVIFTQHGRWLLLIACVRLEGLLTRERIAGCVGVRPGPAVTKQLHCRARTWTLWWSGFVWGVLVVSVSSGA